MKKIRDYIENIGLDYKREMLFLTLIPFLILVLGLLIFILLFKEIIVIIITLIFIGGFILFKINGYTLKKAYIIASHDNEFVNIITYFKIYISHHFNVYSSLKKIVEFSSPWMEERLSIFIESIDKDKSIIPFIEFSKNFKNPLIENVLISIYQMIDEGEDEKRINHFEYLFNRLENQINLTKIEKKKRKLDNLGVYPLIGAGYITILILFSIVSIIGSVINNVL